MRGRHDADEMIEEAAASQEMFLRRQGLAQGHAQTQGLGLAQGHAQTQGLGRDRDRERDRGEKLRTTDSHDRRHRSSYDSRDATRTSTSGGLPLSSNQPQPAPLDKEKLGLLKRAFDRYDVDGDGAISVDDLQLAFLAQGRTQGKEI